MALTVVIITPDIIKHRMPDNYILIAMSLYRLGMIIFMHQKFRYTNVILLNLLGQQYHIFKGFILFFPI